MMKSLRLASLVALTVLGLAVWGSLVGRRAEETPRMALEAVRSSTPIELVGARAALDTAASAPVSESRRVELETQAPLTKVAPNAAEVHGRFVFEGGAPAAGVGCVLTGWGRNSEAIQRFGHPDHWEDVAGGSRGDGHFSLRFEPPRAFQFALEAKAAGYAGPEWRWGEILPGAVVDVGEVELVQGGAIEGRIVDERGEPRLGPHWLVYARSSGLEEFEGRDETQVIAPVDPATASYRAENVMPGRVELEAHTQPARWVRHGAVQVRSGETITVDIVDATPKPSRTIRLDAHSRLAPTIRPDPEHVRAIGHDGVPRAPGNRRIDFGPFVFDDLEPGEYALTIDDPRYRPWSSSAQPGAQIQAELEGTSALALHVRDGTGATVTSFSAQLELQNASHAPTQIEIPEEAVRLSQGALIGLTAGDYRLTIQAGDGLGAADVRALAAGETRALDVVVGNESRVNGHVRYSDGEPARAIDVALLPATPSNPNLAGWPVADRVMFDRDSKTDTTDASGAFRFTIARPGQVFVGAWTPNGAEVSSEILDLAPGQTRDGLELVLPRGGFVSGRILAPPGSSCAGLRLWIGPTGKLSIAARGASDKTADELDADGRFEVGPIPPGPSTARLLLPVQFERSRLGLTRHSDPTGIVLGMLEVVDGGRSQHDFSVPEFPGRIALDVAVNGAASAGLGINLTTTAGNDPSLVTGETDVHGRFGPTLAFAGSWNLVITDADEGWRYVHTTPLLVAAARENHAQIKLQLAEASLRFLEAESGAPLANRSIWLLGPRGIDPGAFAPWFQRKTDNEGRATWKLAAGEYRFHLDPPGERLPYFPTGSAEEEHTAPAIWTEEGPLVREIRL